MNNHSKMPKVMKRPGGPPGPIAKVAKFKRAKPGQGKRRNSNEVFLYQLKQFLVYRLPDLLQQEHFDLPQLTEADEGLLDFLASKLNMKVDDLRSIVKNMLIGASLILERNQRFVEAGRTKEIHQFKITAAQWTSKKDVTVLSDVFKCLHAGSLEDVKFPRWFPEFDFRAGVNGKIVLTSEAHVWYWPLGTAEQRKRFHDMAVSIAVPNGDATPAISGPEVALTSPGEPNASADESQIVVNRTYRTDNPAFNEYRDHILVCMTDAKVSVYADLAKSSNSETSSDNSPGSTPVSNTPQGTPKGTPNGTSNGTAPGSPSSTADSASSSQPMNDPRRASAAVRQAPEDDDAQLRGIIDDVYQERANAQVCMTHARYRAPPTDLTKRPAKARSSDKFFESTTTGSTPDDDGQGCRLMSCTMRRAA
jgi:hypothetical protein